MSNQIETWDELYLFWESISRYNILRKPEHVVSILMSRHRVCPLSHNRDGFFLCFVSESLYLFFLSSYVVRVVESVEFCLSFVTDLQRVCPSHNCHSLVFSWVLSSLASFVSMAEFRRVTESGCVYLLCLGYASLWGCCNVVLRVWVWVWKP